MEEIDKNLLALLTQQQTALLLNDICKSGGPLVAHGLAGTGKTLLALKKMQHLYDIGELNAEKRALYICYWPGIRCEVSIKLKQMGIDEFVDTARFYITSKDFLKDNKNKYKHVFMDETEAIILSFQSEILQNTFYRIYSAYHDGNCYKENCPLGTFEAFQLHSISKLVRLHIEDKITWGELWFLVDTNQALMSLPKHTPDFLKNPQVTLNKLIRSTQPICNFFNAITSNVLGSQYFNFPKNPEQPPIFWVERRADITRTVSEVLVDLCSTKGVRPSDICVIPFLQNEMLSKEAINEQICQKFVENAFRPEGISDVERFLVDKQPNEFLIAWALRVKGLEFKVVVMVFDEDQFDNQDADDRRKIYVMASRCTCMLVVIGDEAVRRATGLDTFAENYCFNIRFDDQSAIL